MRKKMPLHGDDSETAFKRMQRRVLAAENAGGISLEEVLDNVRTVPEGWVLDYELSYWLPPTVVLL
jgi:hypothetical protein